MKKINMMILVAFALVLTMTQCKKNEEIIQNETVTITFDAKRTNSSRVDVNTATGTVDFETGDKVYVGSGGKYVGFLTHNGTNFVGNITNPMEGQPLQFYFLGNVTPAETLAAGTTESCSVVISNQTEHLPVVSCAASYENYVSGVTSYTGHLLNKCALVKFNVTTPSNSPICITGMHNKVTVDFTQNTLTASIDGEGVIMLPAGSGENVEKWAILLPQEALEEGEEGSVYSFDGRFIGFRPTISQIIVNDYCGEGNAIFVNSSAAPIGTINGLFSISANQQVYFSQGNLQYQASTNTWRFADNQWDCIGEDNSNISQTYNGWIDLFGWGTSGWDCGNTYYQPYDSYWDNSGQSALYYGPINSDLTGIYANSDWGIFNNISNGGNLSRVWHVLTKDQWEYIISGRPNAANKCSQGTIGEMHGLILLPDEWDMPSGLNFVGNAGNWNTNTFSISQWSKMEENGAVFLPTAGIRCGTEVTSINFCVVYWSSTGDGLYNAYGLRFYPDQIIINNTTGNYHSAGNSVRLVQDY